MSQAPTGVRRKGKTEAAATCVCLRRRSTNTPQSTHACVLKDRSWLPTVYAAGQVSHADGCSKFFFKSVFFFSFNSSVCSFIAERVCGAQACREWLILGTMQYLANELHLFFLFIPQGHFSQVVSCFELVVQH